MRPRILIVDDEPNMCRSLAILLGEGGRRDVRTARSGEEALATLDEDTHLVVCDLSMPGMDGLEVLRRARARFPEVQVILMTAYAAVPSAIEAMRLGAHDYLIKPFAEDEIRAAVDAALERVRPSRALRLRAGERDRLCDLVGRSPPMVRLFGLIERAAESDATVLIAGESGTGKELVARAVHQLSRRRGRPFIAVNCAAIPETLIESELFGHERGAFTGAHKTKVGRLEQADGGTLFLDEIAELSPAVQGKLLRALAARTFERVGGTETLKVDLRVVAATHRDLSQRIRDGLFREDLFYRLNVVSLTVPPLRQRPGDVALLAELFVREKAAERGQRLRRLAHDAVPALEAHDFPGNVRELENLIERALVLSDADPLTAADLPLPAAARPAPSVESLIGVALHGGWQRLQAIVKDLERQLLERAVAAHGERPNEEIAQLLGTSRRVLELRLQEFGIAKKKPR